MDWKEISQLLSGRMNVLARAVATPPAERAQNQKELFEVEEKERPLIDAAARRYAETGESPLLNPNQSLLLYIRIGHAAQFADFLATAMADNSIMFSDYYTGSQKARVLEFLLVDYWAFAGNSRWRTT